MFQNSGSRQQKQRSMIKIQTKVHQASIYNQEPAIKIWPTHKLTRTVALICFREPPAQALMWCVMEIANTKEAFNMCHNTPRKHQPRDAKGIPFFILFLYLKILNPVKSSCPSRWLSRSLRTPAAASCSTCKLGGCFRVRGRETGGDCLFFFGLLKNKTGCAFAVYFFGGKLDGKIPTSSSIFFILLHDC